MEPDPGLRILCIQETSGLEGKIGCQRKPIHRPSWTFHRKRGRYFDQILFLSNAREGRKERKKQVRTPPPVEVVAMSSKDESTFNQSQHKRKFEQCNNNAG
jgi:dTDP-4-dehydrorhamnose reductase